MLLLAEGVKRILMCSTEGEVDIYQSVILDNILAMIAIELSPNALWQYVKGYRGR